MTDGSDVEISTAGGMIVVRGAAAAKVFNIAGQCVYNGPAEAPIALEHGVYIVKAGEATAKVAL